MKRSGFVAVVFFIMGFAAISGFSVDGKKRTADTHRAMILDLSGRNKTTDTELLALKHCFDIFAIQYTVTDDIKAASESPVVYTAGDLRNTTFTPRELQDLYSYVENGGVLVSQVVTGNKLYSLFGIQNVSDSKKRYRIKFKKPETDSSLSYLDHPEEQTVSLGNKKLYREIIWTHSFDVTDAKMLAETEDKKGIFSVNQYGEGMAYALGVSLSATVLMPHVANDYEAQREWINSFEPGADVFLLIMKSIYEEHAKPFVCLSTIPYGKRTALILTHDVDAQMSFKNMVEYAELEKRFGVSGTYFITTKYFKDEMDIGYYEPERIEYIKKVKELGGDIGSHTVTHSIKFDEFPAGSINVSRADYKVIKNPTVFGEVKVSKELLDRDIPGQNTLSFRAGNLRYPHTLIDALEKTGYRYDSTCSANDIMTNFAYRALRYRKVGSEQSGIIEIPVIFDDSQGLLTPKNMKDLVAKWVDIINANADNEAISTLLIHPSETGHKLKAEELLLTKIKDENIWIGNLTAYGDFWEARSRCEYSTEYDGKTLTVKLAGKGIDERISICVKNVPSTEVRVIDSKGGEIKFTKTVLKNKLLLHFNGR